MIPQYAVCSSLHLLSRMLIACLSVGLLSAGWLCAPNGDADRTGSDPAQQVIACPVIAGPGQVQTQLADRLVSGGGSASLSIAKIRSGGGVAPCVTFFLADSPRWSTVHLAAMHTAQLPWVLILSVCLQV
jgi:hypothetical protein